MSLKTRYRETIRPKLLKDLGLKNVHQVPKVQKVTLNRGLGEAATNSKALEASLKEMATISGQKALVTRAKKAIATFKIRQGMPIGCAVTLRGDRMYAFLERFINLALPRIRDFRGGWVVARKHEEYFNDTATTEIYTLSLHDALPISHVCILGKVHKSGTSKN